MPINKNAIKLAQMLDLNAEKAQKLVDIMPLSDLASLTTAINSDDFLTVREIFNRYKHELDDMPTTEEVQAYYNDQLMVNNDTDEALASTADFFGVKGEDISRLLGNVVEDTRKDRPVFIPDEQVKKAYENINYILSGGKSNGSITEVKNVWQRRMMYGLIPAVVSDIIQDVIDMTPIAVIQQYNMKHGIGDSAIIENKLSLSTMMEEIIEDRLHNIDKDFKDEVQVNLDMGTLGLADDEITELDDSADRPEMDPKKIRMKNDVISIPGWRVIQQLQKDPKTNKFWGKADKVNGSKSVELLSGGSPQEVFGQLKQQIDGVIKQQLHQRASNELVGHSTEIAFNRALMNEIDPDGDERFANVDEYNGNICLFVSIDQTPLTPKRADDRLSSTATNVDGIGLLSFSINTKNAKKLKLTWSRYIVDTKNAIDFGNGVMIYTLKKESDIGEKERKVLKVPAVSIVPSERNAIVKPGIGESISNLIKSITKKKF